MPTLGEITMALRFRTPVKRAKTVASMFFGVILAKRTRTGSWLKAVERVSVIRLETITKVRSLIPRDRFSLIANTRVIRQPRTPRRLFHFIMSLTSWAFSHFS